METVSCNGHQPGPCLGTSTPSLGRISACIQMQRQPRSYWQSVTNIETQSAEQLTRAWSYKLTQKGLTDRQTV
ncbi:hypothetical protein J6590_006291 [Homalodisca vitripennis]|nr:hypothetical protein J6590_006291 [Homalodisca vitripennis]